MELLFILSNLAIVFGYMFIAVFVAPYFRLDSKWAKVGGIIFFMTCAFTHLELAIHAIMGVPLVHDPTLHVWLNHLVQAGAVWVFSIGLYRQFGKITAFRIRFSSASDEVQHISRNMSDLEDQLRILQSKLDNGDNMARTLDYIENANQRLGRSLVTLRKMGTQD